MSEIIQDFKQDYGRKKKIKEIYHLSEEPFYVDSGAGGVVYGAYMKKADEKVTTIEKKAIKIVPGIAIKVLKDITENELEQKYKEIETTIEENDIQVKREISNWQMASNCEHILPLDDNIQVIKWKYNEYIGIDYALPMPFASCLTKIIDKYKKDNCTLNETEDKIIQIGIDLCKALEELENLPTPICHRDIKPANIYYLNEIYCLGDFGISIETGKTQRTGTGTEAYRSPEQAKHVPQSERDHRQDIYSLGLVLYELADKHRIADYENDLSMRRPLPHLTNQYSRGLDQIIHRATQYYVNARFQHASEFRESLEKLQADRTFKLYDEEEQYRTKDPEYIDSPYAEIEIVFSPETLWNAGAFWYEKSKEEGNRFLELKIDEKIMPLAAEKNQDSYRFPVNVYKEEDIEHSKIELSQIISKIEEIDDMYLIGEGGIGKTTALYSVMEDTYKDALYSEDNKKVVIPIFIELSKAPIQYVKAYDSFSSTFIRRYIYCLTEMRREKLGTTEQEKLLHDVMERDEISELEQIDSLLMKENSKAHYLLLLDGLNEVSRKQFEPDAQGNSGSAAEMISYEIQKLQTYKNVTVVITSRADETFYFGENITKYHLMGLEEDTIKEYLENHNISAENIESNKRLKETLKVPLFLKLYSKLSSVEKISTPGEILYAFFNERTHEYSVRLRLREIEAEQQQFKAPYMVNFITEKMQLFIMDFLIPEIGWYMEKNELYTIDKDTIKCIIEPVLKGTQDIDICGKYGRAFFKEYHNGEDGSINTQTYAEQLLKLNSHGDYVDDIIDHCVYSLGIFYVNNQEYGFIHQHIRDYFAALKIIMDMKVANFIAKIDKSIAIKCLSELNNDMLSIAVSEFMSDLSELFGAKNKGDFYTTTLNIYRNAFDKNAGVGVRNIIEILYKVKMSLSYMDFNNLDLRNCQLYGIDLKGTSFMGAKLSKNTLFFKEDSNIKNSGFSPDGKHIWIIGCDDTFRIWNIRALTVECILSKEEIMHPIGAKYSVSGQLFFIISVMPGVMENYIIYVYDSKTMKCIKQKKILRATHPIRSGNPNSVEISPDDKYLIVSDIFNTISLYPIQENEDDERCTLGDFHSFVKNLDECPQILIDPLKRYIVVRFPNDDNVVFYDADTLKEKFKISIPLMDYFSNRVNLCFCSSGQYLAVFLSSRCSDIYILDINKKIIFRKREWNYPYMLLTNECKFIAFNSEICMLLKFVGDGNNLYYRNAQHIILWSFTKNEDVLKLMDTGYRVVYDCFENLVLFKSSQGIQLTDKLNESSTIFLFDKRNYGSHDVEKAMYSIDELYLIIYSKTHIQIWDSVKLYLIDEMSFQKEILNVYCTSENLYIMLMDRSFCILELNTWNLIHKRMHVKWHDFFVYNFCVNSKQNLLIVQSAFGIIILYDTETSERIKSFEGNVFTIDCSETKFVVGNNYTEYKDGEYDNDIIITEWNWNKNNDNFEIVNTISAEIIIKVFKSAHFMVENVTYFSIVNLTYIPNSNKLVIYFKLTYSSKYVVTIWNMDTKKCEKIVSMEDFCDFSDINRNLYVLIKKKSSSSIEIMDLHNLRKIKIKNIKSSYDANDVRNIHENLLLKNQSSIDIYNIKTKKYVTIPFFTNLYVKNAIFDMDSDLDIDSLNVLEMYGAVVK